MNVLLWQRGIKEWFGEIMTSLPDGEEERREKTKELFRDACDEGKLLEKVEALWRKG
ncbi:hypothetical protein DPSP01_011502 [Paraphaeosphaeria sporulosa]